MKESIRIGYIGGQSKRLNEKVIDSGLLSYLGEYVETVPIPPLAIMKLFGGPIYQWTAQLPESLPSFTRELQLLCDKYQISTIYVNMPFMIPYILMAREQSGLKLGVMMIAHSVGSEFWVKQWLSIAPFLSDRDIILASTKSSREALLNISYKYEQAIHLPLCIRIPDEDDMKETEKQQAALALQKRQANQQILVLGRIENVKNIHDLLVCFTAIHTKLPNATMQIAGEYTGVDDLQIDIYKKQVEELQERYHLQDCVTWCGPVIGAVKEELLRASNLLVNVSTDPGETFGYNLIEAKIYGLPAICTAWNGFMEVVDDGLNGYWIDCAWDDDCPTVDFIQASEKITALLLDVDQQQQLAIEAKRHANRFDYRLIMPQIASHLKIASIKNTSEKAFDKERLLKRIIDMPELYNLDKLRQLPFLTETPMSLITTQSITPLHVWYPLIKPVIRHYVREESHAEL